MSVCLPDCMLDICYASNSSPFCPIIILNLSNPPFLPSTAPKDESSALAQTALAAYQYELKKMSLRAVNFLLVNPGKKVLSSHHIVIHI